MREERCIVGVDAGTSVVKAAAFDYAGHEVCSHEIPVELLRLHRDWVEQDMDGLWLTVKACLSEVLGKLQESKRTLAGIGITSTGDGTWLMDRDGHALRGGILRCDGRAGEDAANTRLYLELYQVYGKTAERQMDLWDMRARIINGGKPA
jgi:erythritol kinase (D-erythritol 1-phosphate-forming)